jgi:hypothetical protein
LHEKKRKFDGFLGQFLHVDFGEQERSWVLGKSTNHAVFGKQPCWDEFYARKKVVCYVKVVCLYLIFLVEEMAQEP